MLAKYFLIIRNYVLSVSSQRKYNFYHQNTLLDAFRTNSRNVIGRNPSMVIPLLANQDLTPLLLGLSSKLQLLAKFSYVPNKVPPRLSFLENVSDPCSYYGTSLIEFSIFLGESCKKLEPSPHIIRQAVNIHFPLLHH